MKTFTVEWVHADGFLYGEPTDDARSIMTPVVRLAEVDKLIAEAVWAMEATVHYMTIAGFDKRSDSIIRAQAFLDSQVVQAWRARQEKEDVS